MKNNEAKVSLRAQPHGYNFNDYAFPCNCSLKKDTLIVQSSGYVGNFKDDQFAILIYIHKNKFDAKYLSIKFRQDGNYKLIPVSSNAKSLNLFRKPSFVLNESLIGIFKGKFKEQIFEGDYYSELSFICEVRAE